MIGASLHDDTHYIISVTMEPLVRLLSIPDPLASAPDPPDVENDPYAMDIAAAVDAASFPYYLTFSRPIFYINAQMALRLVRYLRRPI